MATYSDSPWGKRTNNRDSPNSCKWKYFTNGQLLSNRTENAHGLRGRKQRRKNLAAPTHACSLSLSLSLSLSHTHTHTHTLSLSLTHTHTHSLSLSLSHTHTHTLSLSLTHTHTHTHTHTLSLSLSLSLSGQQQWSANLSNSLFMPCTG